MANKSTNSVKGHDHEFVDPPPEDLLCLICTLVAKDPQQTSCCSKIYCKACIDGLSEKSDSSQCPRCKKYFKCFPDDENCNIKTLYQDVRVLAPKWSTFGIHLGVPYSKLKEFQGASKEETCFTNVLSTWLKQENATLDKLVQALRFPGINYSRLARDMERDKHNMKLEMPHLMERLSHCKALWFSLGIALGVPAEELKKFEFEYEKNRPAVKTCLLYTLNLWLESEEANLDTLVEAISLCGYRRLSQEIKAKYRDCNFSSFIVSTEANTIPSSD